MTNIYFVRHAKVDYIADEQNRMLSDEGVNDLESVHRFFECVNIDIAYSSPYKRAVDTIKGVTNSKRIEIIPLDELKERVTGIKHIEDFENFTRNQWQDLDFKLPGGESIRDTQQRGIRIIKEIIKQNPTKNIIIGTHGTLLASIINYFDEEFGYEDWKLIGMPEIIKMKFNEFGLVEIERRLNTSHNRALATLGLSRPLQ